MSLSCSCPDYDEADAEWFYSCDEDFSVFSGKRRKRCSSCKELIEIGATCLRFTRTRGPRSDYEINRFGESVEAIVLASLYHCEECGEKYMNLHALGFCIAPDENVADLMVEYRHFYMNNNGLYARG